MLIKTGEHRECHSPTGSCEDSCSQVTFGAYTAVSRRDIEGTLHQMIRYNAPVYTDAAIPPTHHHHH